MIWFKTIYELCCIVVDRQLKYYIFVYIQDGKADGKLII